MLPAGAVSGGAKTGRAGTRWGWFRDARREEEASATAALTSPGGGEGAVLGCMVVLPLAGGHRAGGARPYGARDRRSLPSDIACARSLSGCPCVVELHCVCKDG